MIKDSQDSVQAQGERVLALIQKDYPQYHPLMAIAHLAHSDLLKEDARLQLECHKTLVKYVTPELKSVEVKAEVNSTRRVIVSLFDEGELQSTIEGQAQISYDAPTVKALLPDPLWKALEFVEEDDRPMESSLEAVA